MERGEGVEREGNSFRVGEIPLNITDGRSNRFPVWRLRRDYGGPVLLALFDDLYF